MATLYGNQMAKLRNSQPVVLPASADVHGRVRCFNERVDLASQAIGDVIEIAKLPKSARFLYGILNTNQSLGASTVSIGVSGAGAKYRAAATLTSTDQPIFFAPNIVSGEGLNGEEIVCATIGTAAFPASGTLRVQLFYTLD